MLQALQFLHQGVNFHELFQGSTRSGEPIIKTVVIREITEHLMILALQKLVDDPGVQGST